MFLALHRTRYQKVPVSCFCSAPRDNNLAGSNPSHRINPLWVAGITGDNLLAEPVSKHEGMWGDRPYQLGAII